MPTASTTPIELESTEEFVEFDEDQFEQPKKRNKQKFHRAIKRDYQRQNFYQKTR